MHGRHNKCLRNSGRRNLKERNYCETYKKNIKLYVTLRTLILPIVLYGCESWSLIMRKKRRMFGNRVLRKIFVA